MKAKNQSKTELTLIYKPNASTSRVEGNEKLAVTHSGYFFPKASDCTWDTVSQNSHLKPKCQPMKIALSPKLSIQSSRNSRNKAETNNCTSRWDTITLNQIQHGWWPPSSKSLWHQNSAMDDPILMKFGTPIENQMPVTVKRSKSKPEVEFEYGGRLFSETRSSSTSGVDWDISSEFGTPIALDLLKWQTWPNQKSEVDFWRYGRHIVKSIWGHNFVGDHPICTKFGRPMQNHMPMIVKWSKLKPEVKSI